MAATSGNTKALATLIKYHQKTGFLNLNLQTIGGETPLMKAVMFCKPDSVSLLMQAGASPLIQTAEGENVFTQAEKM